MIRPVKLGLAGGILWGLCMFICTVIALYTGYAAQFLNLMSSIYFGYTISWGGSLIGFIYGFLDVFIGLFLLGWLYNLLNYKSLQKKVK